MAFVLKLYLLNIVLQQFLSFGFMFTKCIFFWEGGIYILSKILNGQYNEIVITQIFFYIKPFAYGFHFTEIVSTIF